MTGTSSTGAKGLWNDAISADQYGPEGKYAEHLLEQYKLYVEMADRMSARRSLANGFFLTLNTLIVAAVGFALEKLPPLQPSWLIFFPMLAALALCTVWWLEIRSYCQLSSVKYIVIGQLEARLPSSPYWSAEWKVLREGKDPKSYIPLTTVECVVPILFAAVYVVGAILIGM